MRIILTAATAALAFAAAPAAASDDTTPQTKTERIVIVNHVGPAAEGGAGAVQRFRIEGGDLAAHCGGQADEVNAASPDGHQRTRILVCGEGQSSSADRVAKLEQVLARMEANTEIGADQKARVTAALREAIEHARAGQ